MFCSLFCCVFCSGASAGGGAAPAPSVAAGLSSLTFVSLCFFFDRISVFRSAAPFDVTGLVSPLPAPPPVVELTAFLRSSFPTKIPVPEDLYSELVRVFSSVSSMVVLDRSSARREDFLLPFRNSLLLHPPEDGATQSAWHGTLDKLVADVFVLLSDHSAFLKVFVTRDQVSPSHTLHGLRPDVVVLDSTRQHMLFKAEEETNDLPKARLDLQTKMSAWSPALIGSAPYLLSYAFSPPTLEFCAITPSPCIVQTLDTFNLRVCADRLRLLQASFNCFRLMSTCFASLPPANIPIPAFFTERARTNGGYVKLFEKCVEKFVPNIPDVQAGLLQKLFEVLPAVPFVCSPDPVFPCRWTLGSYAGTQNLLAHWAPVGCQV